VPVISNDLCFCRNLVVVRGVQDCRFPASRSNAPPQLRFQSGCLRNPRILRRKTQTNRQNVAIPRGQVPFHSLALIVLNGLCMSIPGFAPTPQQAGLSVLFSFTSAVAVWGNVAGNSGESS
jgi:hypothetical protein